MSDIAPSLIELTQKHAPHKKIGSEQCNKVFGKLKHEISKSPICYSPDFERLAILHAGVSSYELDTCLSQKDEIQHEQFMAFMSKWLSPCQKGYTTIEK